VCRGVQPLGLASGEFPRIPGRSFLDMNSRIGTDPRAMRAAGKTHEEMEIAAEIVGAPYAIRAGYDLEAQLHQLFHGPDGRRRAMGLTLQKALALQDAFGR